MENKWLDNFSNYTRIAILDTETTDRFWNTAAPVQIAAIICDKDGNIIDTFNERIKTTHKIAPEASEVHGIYAKDLVNCRSEKAVLTDFCVWMMNQEVDCILTYNGEAFDRRMLDARCKTLNINYNFFEKDNFPGIDGYYDCVLDAKKMNYMGLKDKLGRKWKLSLVAEILGISNEGAHDAFEDVMMLKEIFWEIDPQIHASRWNNNKKTSSLF